jgi:hypothetical protein
LNENQAARQARRAEQYYRQESEQGDMPGRLTSKFTNISWGVEIPDLTFHNVLWPNYVIFLQRWNSRMIVNILEFLCAGLPGESNPN